ncbi:MAG: hypothetical protein IJC23_04410 [Bacteroidaceae bacterium]|nr:hypothetical protein [Bacteroidaceae bacterium]MBQ3130115.1 hypothetical protein [Bacteroidaceae bacterium]
MENTFIAGERPEREQILALSQQLAALNKQVTELKMAVQQVSRQHKGEENKQRPEKAAPEFSHLIQHEQAEKLLARLHQLIDGCRGADVGSVLLHCVQKNYLTRRPTRKEFMSEFELLGSWASIHKYMDEGNLNALERANRICVL